MTTFDTTLNDQNSKKMTENFGVKVTDYSCVNVNPSPIKLPKDGELLEEFLSPRKLQALTGVDNLETVEYLEMRVNTEQMSLGNFGVYLPNLSQLKLSGSLIPSIRDLGTSLWNLQVLWMPQCNLGCLDGLVTMSNIRELYLAYNEIEDISPCGMLENLEILDLEGNLVEDTTQIHYLTMCNLLSRLTLEGNPISEKPEYKQLVTESLPQVEYLDDYPLRLESIKCLESEEANKMLAEMKEESKPPNPEFAEHWAFINTVLLESGLLAMNSNCSANGTAADSNQLGSANISEDSGRPPSSRLSSSASARRPPLSSRLMTPASRPMSCAGLDPASRPDSTSSNGDSVIEGMDRPDDSQLTAGTPVCGNVARSLRRAKKSQRPMTQAGGTMMSTDLRSSIISRDNMDSGINVNSIYNDHRRQLLSARTERQRPSASILSNGDDSTDSKFDDESCEQILQELSQWRKDYEKTKARIEANRAPQVLTIECSEKEIEEIDVSSLPKQNLNLSRAATVVNNKLKKPTEEKRASVAVVDKNITKSELSSSSKTKTATAASALGSTLSKSSASTTLHKLLNPIKNGQISDRRLSDNTIAAATGITKSNNNHSASTASAGASSVNKVASSRTSSSKFPAAAVTSSGYGRTNDKKVLVPPSSASSSSSSSSSSSVIKKIAPASVTTTAAAAVAAPNSAATAAATTTNSNNNTTTTTPSGQMSRMRRQLLQAGSSTALIPSKLNLKKM